MKMVPKSGPGETTLSEINIIPLVDVILVLLIIFMVAAPMLQQGVDVALPQVDASAVTTTDQDLVLTIDDRGGLYLGNEKGVRYTTETLGDKLKSIFENKEKKVLYLKADKSIEYGAVVKVMAICQQSGVENLGMITVPDETDGM